jgi:hypothetical protein
MFFKAGFSDFNWVIEELALFVQKQCNEKNRGLGKRGQDQPA